MEIHLGNAGQCIITDLYMASKRFLVGIWVIQQSCIFRYKSEFPNLHTAQMSTISYLGIGPSLAGMQTMLLFIVYLVRIHKTKYSLNGMKDSYEMMVNYYF